MSYRTASKGLGVLAAALVFGAPLTASAHAYVTSPPSRDAARPDPNARANKSGPCGPGPRVGSPQKYAPGQQVAVKWEETIDHNGCFQIRFSNANDTGFVLLNLSTGGVAQINDPAGTVTPKMYEATVTMPTQKCPACTLQVLQLMNNAPCTASQDPSTSAGGTYYSCADVCIGNAGDPCTTAPSPDAGAGDAGSDSGTTSSGGVKDSGATSSSSGGDDDDDTAGPTSSSGGTRRPTTSNDDGGCAVTHNSTTELSLAAILGFVGLSIVRRRRNR